MRHEKETPRRKTAAPAPEPAPKAKKQRGVKVVDVAIGRGAVTRVKTAAPKAGARPEPRPAGQKTAKTTPLAAQVSKGGGRAKGKVAPAAVPRSEGQPAKRNAVAGAAAAEPARKAGVPEKIETKAEPAPDVSRDAGAEARQHALSEMLNLPDPEILRPFRKAAEQTRQQQLEARRARSQANFLAKVPNKGKKYAIDLRVHSPGTIGYFMAGGIEPGPALVRLASVKGLDMIGITDYYNAAYIDLVQQASVGTGVTILPGIVVCATVGICRQVYLMLLFPETYSGADVSRVMKLLDIPPEAQGRKEYILEKPFPELLQIVERNGGIVIPSRVDKTPYRQLAIPALVEEYGLHSFDLSHPDGIELFRERWPNGGFTFFSFSNATALGQIGNRGGKIRLAEPGFAGLKQLVARRAPGVSKPSGTKRRVA